MRRREFLGILSGAAAAWSLDVRAQQGSMPVIGFLGTRGPDDDPHLLSAWRRGLKDAGHIEGQNLRIEYRWAENRYDRLPALATDLVQSRVHAIYANGPAAQAAKAATTTIPIIFTAGFDPVQLGLVTSLSRPGGNITGISILDVELGPKRLELLHESVPTTKNIGVLVNQTDRSRAEIITKGMQAAAETLGLQAHVLSASTDQELETAFSSLAKQQAGALAIGGDPFFNSRGKQLGELSIRHAMPTIFQFRTFAEAGGLASYGTDLAEAYFQSGRYVGRVLRGENPADLPIQLATKIELIINLKTAKALGLDLPPSILVRADEVIE
jgi:putative ABC transport system substrate-binding protein